MYESPVGVDGLHEDISGMEVPDPPVIEACKLALELERQKPKPQYHEVYRHFAPELRRIAGARAAGGREEAQRLLRTLYLEQTLPENELHSPDWIDGYTNEPIVDLMEDKELVVEERRTGEELLPEWQRFLATRAPYEDQVLANKFIEANWEYPGQEEEIYFEEDRGYEPEHFEVNREGRPDGQLGEVWERTRVERQHLSDLIAKGHKDGLMADQIRALVQKDTDFLQRLQDLINEGINPANVATVFMRWQHGLGFDPEHAELITLKQGTLRDFVNEYWEELSESLEAMGPAWDPRGPVSDTEINELTEGWLEEYLDQIPIDASPRRSKWFCEGYLNAVLAGSPRPQDEGMANWRRHTSPAGSKAYDEAIKNGASIRQAMGVYWRYTKRPGPPVPKKVVSIKPSGLKLASGRFVAWSVAVKIAKDEGFEEQERLREVLSNRGWGLALVAAL